MKAITSIKLKLIF